MENIGMFSMNLFEKVFNDLFLFAGAGGIDPTIAVFEFISFVKEEGDVAPVIDDELGSKALGVDDGFPRAIPVLLESFTFPSEDGNAGSCNRSGGLILGRENIATGPPNIGSEGNESFDEDCGLNRHMQGTSYADTS